MESLGGSPDGRHWRFSAPSSGCLDGVRLGARFFAPTLLLAAGAAKLMSFAESVESGRRMLLLVLPHAHSWTLSLIDQVVPALPFVELALALGLYLAWGRVFRFIAYLTLILAVVFVSSRAALMVRGLPVACRCFGPASSLPHSDNILLLLTGALVLAGAILAYGGDPLERNGVECSL